MEADHVTLGKMPKGYKCWRLLRLIYCSCFIEKRDQNQLGLVDRAGFIYFVVVFVLPMLVTIETSDTAVITAAGASFRLAP